jgi:hypothetical protein
MAYIPDAAFADIEEVGWKAFQLYAFYCKHGSMSNNRVKVSLERAAKFLGVSYSNASRCNALLKKSGWLSTENGWLILLKGWTGKDAKSTLKKGKKAAANSSLTDEILPETAKNSAEISREKETEFAENGNQKLLKTANAYYKEEPALSNQRLKTEKNTERESENAPSENKFLNKKLKSSGRHGFSARSRRSAENEALKIFEQKFRIRCGDTFAEELCAAVTNLDVWKILLHEKSAYADGSESERMRVMRWILTAYHEKTEKMKNGTTQPTYRNQQQQRNEQALKRIAAFGIIDEYLAGNEGEIPAGDYADYLPDSSSFGQNDS